ncbi:hypothetical protein BN1723_013587 [Verticillium longisporum]|uniref:Uncharacterized protein n=1 Tax=Verticillium longisporum TaxID=100787 RepID=A0A0G4LU66_VERLO|nr:hypothetical protein BN1723_013587 [Verticillium longisporum]
MSFEKNPVLAPPEPALLSPQPRLAQPRPIAPMSYAPSSEEQALALRGGRRGDCSLLRRRQLLRRRLDPPAELPIHLAKHLIHPPPRALLGASEMPRHVADIVLLLALRPAQHGPETGGLHVVLGADLGEHSLDSLALPPFILLNYRRKSTEGVSMLFFLFACLGNLTYVLSIFAYDPHCGRHGCAPGRGYARYILVNLSWLAGSMGTLLLDMGIFVQFFLYRKDEDEDDDEYEGDDEDEDEADGHSIDQDRWDQRPLLSRGDTSYP